MASRIVNFRASDDLADTIAEQARQSGVTTSEWLRRQVQAGARPEMPIHTRAARGDGDAHAHLAEVHYQHALSGSAPPVLALCQAALFARLAACSRGTREDHLVLIYLGDLYASALRDAGLDDLADAEQAAAVALAESMASDGDEEVGQMVVASAGHLPRKVMSLAGVLHNYTKEIVDDRVASPAS